MSIGDSVNPASVDETSLLAMSIATREPEAFRASDDPFSRPLFDVARDLVERRRPGRRSWLPAWLGARKRPVAARPVASMKISLRGFLDLRNEVRIIGTRDGLEAVAVPFPHVALLGSLTSDAALLENRLSTALAAEWDDYVDPLVGVRVRCFDSPDYDGSLLTAFCGRGVFLPQPGEKPVGRIELVLPRSASAPPENPELPNRQRAALYRGQTGLAFSHSELLTAATARTLPDDNVVFHLGLRRQQEGGGRPLELRHVVPKPPAGMASHPTGDVADYWLSEAEPSAGFDGAYEVVRNDELCFNLRYSLDDRPSRLWPHAPRDRTAYRIVGVLAPPPEAERNLDRWWIDLDAAGHLVASAVTRPARSVIVRDDGLASYDWRRYRSNPSDGAKHQLEEITLDGRRAVMLAPPPGQDFGALMPPAADIGVVFGADEWGPEAFGLDWLDFSGAAENVRGETKRLAALSGSVESAPFIPGLEPRRPFADRTILTAADGGADFVSRAAAQRRPRDRLIVGPLCLELSQGSAG